MDLKSMDICKFLRNGFFAQSVSVGILTFALLSVSVTAVQETSRPNNTENNSENEDKENPPLTFLTCIERPFSQLISVSR